MLAFAINECPVVVTYA